MSSFLSKRLALAVISIVSAPVGAATVFEVNTFQDGADISQGGTCATATGACSLRAAIQEANFQTSTGPHTIKLPAGTYNLSLQGSDDGAAMGDLDINSSMTIEGFGADKTIIQLASSVVNTEYRIFHIVATSGSPTVTIKGVTIKGGMSSLGAGIYLQTGTLNLNDSQVDSNNANQGTVALGGGIYSNGTLKLVGTTISNNNVLNNTSGQGGGIYVSAQAMTTYITNSTISTNTVSGSQGGGIYNASPGTFVIASSTITQNAVNASGTGGSGIFNAATSANVRLKNTILAQNRANSGSSIPDCAGPLASDGYNLVGFASSGGVCTFSSVTGDQVGPVSGAALNASLATAPALNGGTVLNYLPTSGSPAIELGNPAGCTSAENVALTTDQRGYVRASLSTGSTPGMQGRCDIGAIEFNSSFSATGVSGGTGPVAGPQAFTAYFDIEVSGSLLGANPDLLKTDTSVNYAVTTCSGSTAGNPTSSSGLIFCPDPAVTPRGTLSGPNPATGYFLYSPRNSNGPITGTDSFGYYVQNTSGQRASGVVSIVISNVGLTVLTPPVVPTGGLTLAAKVGNKVRAALPYIDVDAGGSRFTITFATNPTKGTAAIKFNNAANNLNSSYLEYTPFDNSSGTDTFTLNIDDGTSTSQLPVNVTIGAGTTVVSSSAPVALGALIREDVSRAQTTSLSDFSSVLRNPSNVVVTLAKSADSVGSTGALLGSVAYSNGVFTFTPPVGGVSAADNRASFRINGTYTEAGTLRTLPEVTVTLNFAVAGVPGVPTLTAYTANAVSRTGVTSNISALSSSVSGAASTATYEVAGSSGVWGQTAVSTYGTITLLSTTNGAISYSVNSAYSTGIPGNVSSESFQYRVRYLDASSTAQYTSAASLLVNFAAVSGTVPTANNHVANSVPRTSGYSSASSLVTSLTSPPTNPVFQVSPFGMNNWQASATSTYGNLLLGAGGTYTYTLLSTYSGSGVPASVPSETFQYRVGYSDTSGLPQYSAPANLVLNFVTAGVPRALTGSGHAVPGDSITVPLKYITSANELSPVSGTQYFITQPPNKGKLFMADSSGMEITTSTVLTSAQVRYVANAGASGQDTFRFKVKEPVSGGTPLDSAPAEITIDIGHGLASVPTPLEEGGGGSLSPLALLAMLALYGRRRFH